MKKHLKFFDYIFIALLAAGTVLGSSGCGTAENFLYESSAFEEFEEDRPANEEFANEESADDGFENKEFEDRSSPEIYAEPDESAQEDILSEESDDIADEESDDNEYSCELTDLSSVPEYDGSPYAVINDNVPFFDDSEITTEVFEEYSDLDSLGRCGVAYANICTELMPTEERESISSVTPSGWHSVTYDIVDGNYLYNRCHLIGFQLAGENANELNLITGTRYLNVDGMLPFENMVADYVEETDNHVLYRVTPYYEGDDLVASGVLMEAVSVEDDGEGIMFCVYCYNVQPGVEIDYSTGESSLSEDEMQSGGD